MTEPSERDREMAHEALLDGHCRYCHNLGPDAHPAMKCNGDLEDLHESVAKAIAEARAEGERFGRDKAAKIIHQHLEDVDWTEVCCAGYAERIVAEIEEAP